MTVTETPPTKRSSKRRAERDASIDSVGIA